jgi:hypothetical protein
MNKPFYWTLRSLLRHSAFDFGNLLYSRQETQINVKITVEGNIEAKNIE